MRIWIGVALLLCTCVACNEPGTTETPFRVALSLNAEAVSEIESMGLQTPVNGRAFVIFSRSDEREPRLQVNVNGVPFFGMDVEEIQAEGMIRMDPSADGFRGFPLEQMNDLPPGDYFVQGFLSVYTTFNRADGHTVSMHLNSGAGQNQWRAPGNLHSEVQQITIEAGKPASITLSLDQVIPPIEALAEGDVLQQGNPPDTDYVKFVKIQSEAVSDFWGHPMYIGANVLLPEGYDPNGDTRYPVLYMQGHFPGRRAPLGFEEGEAGRGRTAGFADYWTSGDAPKMIVVSFRDANPYYDTSYSVNSENVGPYGDAITQELIPYLEQEFKIIPEPWARVVAGGSTGGWEALAMQIFYPDYFGGSWGWCPDPVDFNYYQIVNIYEDENAYYSENEWHRIERPNARRFDGNIVSTVRQENYMELARGNQSRSGGQWAIWEAVFGPVGDDGYPRPIWNHETGAIDKTTAQYWKEQYDLREYLNTQWETIGPKLNGKLHIATGDMDTYYLDNAVYLLEDFFNQAENPTGDASFEYGRRKPHCWIGASPSRPGEDLNYIEFVNQVATYMNQNR